MIRKKKNWPNKGDLIQITPLRELHGLMQPLFGAVPIHANQPSQLSVNLQELGQWKVYFRRLLPENWGLTGFWGESKCTYKVNLLAKTLADIKVSCVMSHVFVDAVFFDVHIVHLQGVHIYESIETCIIELCVGIRQVAKERDTQKGPKPKQVLESLARNPDMNWFGQPYSVKRYWHKHRSRYKSSSEFSWLHFDLAT